MEPTQNNSILVKTYAISTRFPQVHGVPYKTIGGNHPWFLCRFGSGILDINKIIMQYGNQLGIFSTYWRKPYPTLAIQGREYEFSYFLQTGDVQTSVWGDGKIRYSTSLAKYIFTDTTVDLSEEPEPYWIINEFPTVEKPTVELEDACNAGARSMSITPNYLNFPEWISVNPAYPENPYVEYKHITNGKTFTLSKLLDENEKEQSIKGVIYYGNLPLWKTTPTES